MPRIITWIEMETWLRSDEIKVWLDMWIESRTDLEQQSEENFMSDADNKMRWPTTINKSRLSLNSVYKADWWGRDSKLIRCSTRMESGEFSVYSIVVEPHRRRKSRRLARLKKCENVGNVERRSTFSSNHPRLSRNSLSKSLSYLTRNRFCSYAWLPLNRKTALKIL